MQVIYLEVRKIYQPGYSGGRGERQKIYLVLEYELSSVAGILCVTVLPERTPRKISPIQPALFFSWGSQASLDPELGGAHVEGTPSS